MMTEQRCDRIEVNDYGDAGPLIDFTIDGQDRGGFPPYYFSFMEIRKDDLPNGQYEVGFKQLVGPCIYYGPMSEEHLERIADYFDMILETDGSTHH